MIVIMMKTIYYVVPGNTRREIHCVFDGTRKQANKYCRELNERAKGYFYYPQKVKIVKGE